MSVLLEVERLTVRFPGRHRGAPVVDDVTFQVAAGETVALVGESGAGKTMVSLAVSGLLPGDARVSGESRVRIGGQEVAHDPAAARGLRGRVVGKVFQDAGAALNPVRRVGSQLREVLARHRGISGREADSEVIRLLGEVRLPDPEAQRRAFPHQLSGGMRQRALLALALAGDPSLLVADEPTSALDASVELRILELIRRLTLARGLGTLLVTHDFGVVARACDRVLVMYAGELVEEGPTRDILSRPRHPYTRALLQALPARGPRKAPLPVLPGQMPDPELRLQGCHFRERCPRAMERCGTRPPMAEASGVGHVRCWAPLEGGPGEEEA